ncbi:MAG: PKD domain-containing protein [Ferruginibacter sp.]
MKHYLLPGILFYCLFLSFCSAAQMPRTVIPFTQKASQKKYDSIRPYHEGFAAVSLHHKWGFINAAGNEVIAPQYKYASDFIEDNAVVFSDRWIMIDTVGRFIKESYQRQAERYMDAYRPVSTQKRAIPEIMYNVASNAAAARATLASTCPPNIDFEFGNFANWYCYTGRVTTVAGLNTFTWFNNSPPVNTPVNGRHTMITATTPSAMDPYGNFPINPPDGSGRAIKLGNDRVNDSAEKVRYILTVPTNALDYSVSFQYAVVLENPNSGHTPDQKPRLIARVINAATNTVVQCADFLYVAAGSLPGFYNSTVDANVKCKAWTRVFVNLSGYPGQTMYIEFTTADCTLGAHFGYGYLDVGPCSQPVISQYQCTPANSVTFTGPGDFQTYNWYNQNYTTVLGTSSTLILNPPPPNGVILHLELIPFNGSTCRDTLDVTVNSPLPVADAGPPVNICPGGSVQIGTAAIAGATYQWSPATYLSNAQAANPTSTATQSMTYILTVTGTNGCTAKDTTQVLMNPVPVTDFTVNNMAQCIAQNSFVFQNASSISAGTYTLSWDFGDGGTSTSLSPTHVYATAGSYTVTLTATSNIGCINVKTMAVNVLPNPTVVSAAANASQCLAGNNFSFSNGSTASVGPLTYAWSFGDGGTSILATPTHQYTAAGTYTVKLVVSTPAGCKDSVSYPVIVSPMPVSDFTVNNLNQCIGQNSFVFQNASSISAGTYTLAWILVMAAHQLLYRQHMFTQQQAHIP